MAAIAVAVMVIVEAVGTVTAAIVALVVSGIVGAVATVTVVVVVTATVIVIAAATAVVELESRAASAIALLQAHAGQSSPSRMSSRAVFDQPPEALTRGGRPEGGGPLRVSGAGTSHIAMSRTTSAMSLASVTAISNVSPSGKYAAMRYSPGSRSVSE